MNVPIERVAAVVAFLPDGRRRWGSGFLVTPRLVLTAWHCTVADPTTARSIPLTVRRWTGQAWESAAVGAVTASRSAAPVGGLWGLDVALLELDDPPWGRQDWTCPPFARLDRSESGELADCVVLGYPTYELKPDGVLTTAEVRGFIRQGEGLGPSQDYLVLRDEKLGPVHAHPDDAGAGRRPASPWGGLSGAVVFHHGRILGHVVEHRPYLGSNPLTVVPITSLALASGRKARHIAAALGLPDARELPYAAQPATELGGLVDLLDRGELPKVGNLTPYQLGADPTRYGNKHAYGPNDPYLLRTANRVDERLAAILAQPPDSIVLLVGPSKSGKTRTAFEAVRASWPQATLAKPDPSRLAELVGHPRIAGSTGPLVVWLDDLQRFLVGASALTPALLARLMQRPGPTAVVATIRSEERSRLSSNASDFSQGARQLLDDAAATTVVLEPTSRDAAEQAAAATLYPELDLNVYGLAEQLAGAPVLLRQYTDAEPLLLAVLQTAIDWERSGMTRPIAEVELAELARDRLTSIADFLEPTEQEMLQAIVAARTPQPDADGRTTGRLAAIAVHRGTAGDRSYTPFPYLVAHDNGQDGTGRTFPETFWDVVLARADPVDADAVGSAAYYRGSIAAAIRGLRIAAEAGNDQAMRNLGVLLAYETPEPDVAQAQQWFQRAADAGNVRAYRSLGLLYSDRVVPPRLELAQQWMERAARAGDVDAMVNLAFLLKDKLDPPQLEEARSWLERAAAAGDTGAMINLALLLSGRLDPPDPGRAVFWYERAAELGNATAMFNLGVRYAEHDDLPRAMSWYERAAAADYRDAMLNLGILLAEQPDPTDRERAVFWYERAADLGDVTAMFNLGVFFSVQSDPPDLVRAVSWYEQAAATGLSDAMLNLGTLFEEQSDPPDRTQAVMWFERAAQAGRSEAMVALGVLAEQSDPPDRDRARSWYEQAAELGQATAMFNLGVFAQRRDPPDLATAERWFQLAAEAGSGEGLLGLGSLLARSGDRASAVDHWTRALAGGGPAAPIAAIGLGTLAGFDQRDEEADRFLRIAQEGGIGTAARCRESLAQDERTRRGALAALEALPQDTDALNFLGIAAQRSGDQEAAVGYWTQAIGLRDAVAPLLIALSGRQPQ